MEPGIQFTRVFDPPNFTFPFGTHVAVVDIDLDTGKVTLVKYVSVDDCGNVVNPSLVDGQVQGGVAQGTAQALFEEIVYDAETGQLVTGSLGDYAAVRADMLPMMENHRTVTVTPSNPLGVKGIGEAGHDRRGAHRRQCRRRCAAPAWHQARGHSGHAGAGLAADPVGDRERTFDEVALSAERSQGSHSHTVG